jgi:hypothetical protein
MKKYMATPVPRFLRQSRLGYLPTHCIIDSYLMKGNEGANLYLDLVMLPVQQFSRMRSNVGLQHVIAPALNAGPSFNPGFVINNVKEVAVPDSEPDPEAYAKNYFLKEFGLSESGPAPETPQTEKSDFMTTARECTVKD